MLGVPDHVLKEYIAIFIQEPDVINTLNSNGLELANLGTAYDVDGKAVGNAYKVFGELGNHNLFVKSDKGMVNLNELAGLPMAQGVHSNGTATTLLGVFMESNGMASPNPGVHYIYGEGAKPRKATSRKNFASFELNTSFSL